MTNEMWRSCLDNPYYQVSNWGNVRNVDRVVPRGDGFLRRRGGPVAVWKDSRGYRAFTAHCNGKPKHLSVHREVLRAFVGEAPEGLIACHNDGDKMNNRPGNLRWDTHQGNHDDMQVHGTQHRGELTPGAKLTTELVRYAKRGGEAVFDEVAAKVGATRKTVERAVYGVTWKHLHDA